MIEIGSPLYKAIDQLGRAVAEESKGCLPNLGLISAVLSELMCSIDAFREAVLKKKKRRKMR